MALAEPWILDPELSHLNHGSFGACPREVLAVQTRWRERMEANPMRFFVRELEGELDEARRTVAGFLGVDAAALAFVPNATAGVNAVLRSLPLKAGDELLTTDHTYNAVRAAMEYVAAGAGARVVVASVPFPLRDAASVVERVLAAAGPRTRLAVLDHVTSPTALVLPIATLVSELHRRGIDTLVDGAHAPGMLPLAISEIGAAYYTGNLHKWVCAPKGAAFLHVREDRRHVRPLSISHGANSPREDRSRYLLEFDWTGTFDPSPWLAAPEALRVMGALHPHGWPGLTQANRALALQARDVLCRALDIPPPAPDDMIGAMAALPLPAGEALPSPPLTDPLQEALWRNHRIEALIVPWPSRPQRLLRISAQLYNRADEYERLAEVLPGMLH